MFDYLMKQTKIIESEIDHFLENITNSGLVFKEAVKDYLDADFEALVKRRKKISKIESQTDEVRKKIKYKLYKEMLIPESRGDVLGLLENMDDLADIAEEVVLEIDIERPVIKDNMIKQFEKLSEYSSLAIEEISKAAAAFFRDFSQVNNFINKVKFYESEADDVEEKLKRIIFNDDRLKHSEKIQLRYFVERIASLSDEAEEVSERLSVYTIKRSL